MLVIMMMLYYGENVPKSKIEPALYLIRTGRRARERKGGERKERGRRPAGRQASQTGLIQTRGNIISTLSIKSFKL